MNEQNEYVTKEVEMLNKQTNKKNPESSGAEELNTVSPLHMNLQVAIFFFFPVLLFFLNFILFLNFT